MSTANKPELEFHPDELGRCPDLTEKLENLSKNGSDYSFNSKPEHSPVGGSSLYRVAACAGSVNLIKRHKLKSESSPYAREGTDAHTLGEMCLNHKHDAIEYLGRTLPLGHEVTEEMADAVQTYLNFIRSETKRGDSMYVEIGFHAKQIHDLAYGTSDCCIYKKKEQKLIVVDYKHGKGIAVEIENNLQLIFYAIGALLKLKLPVQEVETGIVQPRCYHEDGPIRRKTYDLLELMDYTAQIQDVIEKALDPDCKELKAGDHCTFCPAMPLCPAQQQNALEMAKLDFEILTTYDLDEIEAIAQKLDQVEAFTKKVREFMYQEANRGVNFKHFKLVDKVARRAWKSDIDETVITDKFDFFELDDITERKLRSPAQLEKTIKDKFPARKKVDKPKRQEQLDKLEELYETKSSGTTLVPISNKRQAVATGPNADFEVL